MSGHHEFNPTRLEEPIPTNESQPYTLLRERVHRTNGNIERSFYGSDLLVAALSCHAKRSIVAVGLLYLGKYSMSPAAARNFW